MEQEDSEIMFYNAMAKAKNGGVYDLLGDITSKVINLYMKRFGNKEYATSIPEIEFTEQLLDCVNHLIAVDKNAKNFFNVINEEKDQMIIIASMSTIMIG